MKKKIYVYVSIILLIICLWLGFTWWSFLKSPLLPSDQQPRDFLFPQGMSVKQVATTLANQKLLRHPGFFTLFVRLKGLECNLKAGEYRIIPGVTTPSRLLTKMVRGDAIRHTFTIVEGWTFAQVLAALNSNPYVQHTIQKLTPAEIMAYIGHVGELPEGRFAPDTYLFSGKIKDTKLLISAYNLMAKRLNTAWQKRDVKLPYHCPYQVLIVASLIEKETAVLAEKPLIAGVILRRWSSDRLLQIDPTIIYGLGEKYRGKLTKADYYIDSPYNTYTRKGLPPTPIAMPSESSIVAATQPIIGSYLYYAAKGDGTHKFSATLKEQEQAVKKYIRK